MEAAFSTQTANQILQALLRSQSFTVAGVYLALWQGDPGVDGSGGSEISTAGTGYIRQIATFDVPVNRKTQLTNPINFPSPTANYGAPVDHWALFDAASGGNFLLRGEFDESETVTNAGPAVSIPAGDITIQLT